MWLRSLFAKRERTRFSERGNWHASLCFKPRPVQLDSPETTQTQLRRKSSAEVDSLWGRVPGKLDLAFKANTVSTWLDLPFFPLLPSPIPSVWHTCGHGFTYLLMYVCGFVCILVGMSAWVCKNHEEAWHWCWELSTLISFHRGSQSQSSFDTG